MPCTPPARPADVLEPRSLPTSRKTARVSELRMQLCGDGFVFAFLFNASLVGQRRAAPTCVFLDVARLPSSVHATCKVRCPLRHLALCKTVFFFCCYGFAFTCLQLFFLSKRAADFGCKPCFFLCYLFCTHKTRNHASACFISPDQIFSTGFPAPMPCLHMCLHALRGL